MLVGYAHTISAILEYITTYDSLIIIRMLLNDLERERNPLVLCFLFVLFLCRPHLESPPGIEGV